MLRLVLFNASVMHSSGAESWLYLLSFSIDFLRRISCSPKANYEPPKAPVPPTFKSRSHGLCLVISVVSWTPVQLQSLDADIAAFPAD